jgi:hypothetical protein
MVSMLGFSTTLMLTWEGVLVYAVAPFQLDSITDEELDTLALVS